MLRMGVAYSYFEPVASLFGVRGSVPAIRRHSAVAHTGQQVMPRKVGTGTALQKLQNVKNVRDLAEACANIRPGLLFRSACPHGATAGDIQILRDVLNVKQLVDLRSDEERREDADDCLLLKEAEVVTSAKRGRLSERETFQIPNHYDESSSREFSTSAASAEAGVADGVDGGAGNGDGLRMPQSPSLTIHHVALLEKNRYYRSLLTRLPRLTSASAVFWSLLSLDRAKTIVLKEVNQGGLPQLYEILLDSATNEICTALKIIRAAAERGETTLFFCKIGKDRTGLTAALVLAACGATTDEIIADYVRSDGADGVKIALGGLENDKVLAGLDVAAFSRAPAEAMAACLSYIDRAYGGVIAYLDYIGFDEDERARLRAALSDGISTPDVKPGNSQNGNSA